MSELVVCASAVLTYLWFLGHAGWLTWKQSGSDAAISCEEGAAC